MNGTPTVVQTQAGPYTIPQGPLGSQAWAREASLIAAAYRFSNPPDLANADKWQREYGKRKMAADRRDQQADYQAIIDADGSWLDGPARILSALAQHLDQIIKGAENAINWLPILVGGALVVMALGFWKGSLKLGR